MRVLLDECLPAQLKHAFPGHIVKTVPETGWRSVKDGELLRLAAKTFDVFITIDQKMERQHDLTAFSLGFIIVHVKSNRSIDFEPILPALAKAVAEAKPGTVLHVEARP